MSEKKILKLSKSIIVKSLLLLVSTMAVVTIGGTYYFAQRQTQMTLKSADETNIIHLQQMSSTLHNELFQFGNQLTLLAKASEIKSMDPAISTSYLKSYNISPLFISGEKVSLFDRNDSLICDNAMIASAPTKYPVDFSKITPHRPFISGWYRDSDNMRPKRAFATVVSDNAKGNGSLVASFSAQRLWRILSESKVGKKGYYIVINSEGEILFHPDLETWLTEPHKIAEIGIKGFDPKADETKGIKFYMLSDDQAYLANYVYDASYDFGLLSLQPKSEIDEQVASLLLVSKVMLATALIAILLISFWLYRKLVLPMGRFVQHTIEISEGDMEAPDIDVGNRQDEIGILAKHFNIMHHTIKRQIAELNAHREMLEQEVQERTKELEEANKKLDLISRTDELTGLPNRRDMLRTIDNEIQRVTRSKKPFCFIFIDIDHFKNVNDTYGHACGDEVLKHVSATIRNLLRKYDVLARYGGEEFLTLLPETDLEGAKIVAERFRKTIEDTTVIFGKLSIKVTITLGVARYDHALGADKSIQMADRALYEGKETGRNKVIVWKPES
ncbi:sensor domain-containing diguanylate cyclase [Fibrobacter sp.]